METPANGSCGGHALTHGDKEAHAAAAVGVHLAAQTVTSRTVDQAVNATFGVPGVYLGTGLMIALDEAQQAGLKVPRQVKWLRQLGPTRPPRRRCSAVSSSYCPSPSPATPGKRCVRGHFG